MDGIFTKLAWIHYWDKFKSWLDFGDLDLIFKVTGGLKWKFLVPTDISWTNGWNFTKLAWIHDWDKFKSWLDFGDLDLIFKVTGGHKWQFLVPTISLEPMDGISPNLHGYINGTSLRAEYILVTLTSFSRSLEDLDDNFLYPRYLLNQWMEFHQTCMDTSLGQV